MIYYNSLNEINAALDGVFMPRLTKIYTRKGDTGYTSLGNNRISKDDLLIEVLGSLDELNSYLGLLLAQELKQTDIQQALLQIQNELFDMGGEFHVPERLTITPEKVIQLEHWLDDWNKTLPSLKEFILPGGNVKAAICHVARTVCRRTERQLVRLHRQAALTNPEMLRYLNRLSDLLFVIARILARETNLDEKMWEHAD